MAGSTECNRRKMRMIFPSPPTRFQLLSPYTGTTITSGTIGERSFTKEQLDMRRKVEILKYAGSQKNNFIGNVTRAERFSQIVRTGGQLNRISSIDSTCDTVPTLSTRSNVPGKPMVFTLDKTVPLYNYATNNRSYSNYPDTDDLPWRFFLNNNLSTIQSGIPIQIGTIEILQNNPNSFTIFELSIPYTKDSGVSLNSENITLTILYQGSPIFKLSSFDYTNSTDTLIHIKNIKVYSSLKYFYDIHLQIITDSSDPITIDPTQITIANSD